MRTTTTITLLLLFLTRACSPAIPASLEATPLPSPQNAAIPATMTPTLIPATVELPTPPAAPTQTEAIQPTLTQPLPAPTFTPAADAILIDHTSLALFEQIPDEYIAAASRMPLLFRHASVGKNVTDGLDCLMNNFAKRPFHCDKGIPPGEVVFNAKYDRSNWLFEFHQPPPGINPPWEQKLNGFLQRIETLPPGEAYAVIGYKHGYVEAVPGAKIDDLFFNNNPNDKFPSVEDLEALEAQHPEMRLVYWTMGLPRLGFPDSQNFNQQMRRYAAEQGKVLMDLADIESHDPAGNPCVDSEGKNIEAICDEYTDEEVNGHLNALGSLRMAKAMWVLMARLAGWQP
ncbi:MAG: hypothetical protein L0Z70_06970 [Chloroflexi bacterium]|nr:hypothetical protein [Chloroflexota bacterium]